MEFLYAFLIAGTVCVITQILADLKIPFPVVAIVLMVVGGGLLTKLGVVDRLNALSPAGLAVTAVGCGNGAYSSGAALALGQGATALILSVALNLILVAMGAACGGPLYQKFKDLLP